MIASLVRISRIITPTKEIPKGITRLAIMGTVDFLQGLETPSAEGGMVRKIPHFRAEIPATLAFFSLGLGHPDGQTREWPRCSLLRIPVG